MIINAKARNSREAVEISIWYSVQFSHSVMSDSLRPHESQHPRPPCQSPTPGVTLNFCLSEKLLLSPLILNEILAGYSNLGCRFFLFSTLNISCHSLLACRVSAEISSVKLMGFPLYVTCCFSLAAFNILSLCLVFVSLISMCLGMFLLGFILYGTLCFSWS